MVLATQRKLTARQTQLVDTLVAKGCSIKEAAKVAGYSSKNGSESGRVTASRTLRLPHVQAYYQNQMLARVLSVAPKAVHRLVALLDANSEYVQLQASKQILDRIGMMKPAEHLSMRNGSVTVEIDLR